MERNILQSIRFKKDKREGYGIEYYNNGNKYEGEFKNDKREGYGIYYFNVKYEKEWKNSKREEDGILYYNNEDRYIGEWKNDIFDGNGIFYIKNKRVYSKFKNKKPTKFLLIRGNEFVYVKNIENKNNYILCEYIIEKYKLNRPIQILNCYEEVKKEYLSVKGINNEKEIKDNCELYLNDKKIDFCLKYKFEKEGKYIIIIIFEKHLTNTNYMFCNISSLTSLNLSNFISNNVINMSICSLFVLL